MAVGNMAYGRATLLNGQSINIVPDTAGIEWGIHNITIPFGYACELYQTDGTDDILDCNTSTSLRSYTYHCNVYSYYKVKNISGSTIIVSYEGLIMAE